MVSRRHLQYASIQAESHSNRSYLERIKSYITGHLHLFLWAEPFTVCCFVCFLSTMRYSEPQKLGYLSMMHSAEKKPRRWSERGSLDQF